MASTAIGASVTAALFAAGKTTASTTTEAAAAAGHSSTAHFTTADCGGVCSAVAATASHSLEKGVDVAADADVSSSDSMSALASFSDPSMFFPGSAATIASPAAESTDAHISRDAVSLAPADSAGSFFAAGACPLAESTVTDVPAAPAAATLNRELSAVAHSHIASSDTFRSAPEGADFVSVATAAAAQTSALAAAEVAAEAADQSAAGVTDSSAAADKSPAAAADKSPAAAADKSPAAAADTSPAAAADNSPAAVAAVGITLKMLATCSMPLPTSRYTRVSRKQYVCNKGAKAAVVRSRFREKTNRNGNSCTGPQWEALPREYCLRGACWSVDGSAFLTWTEDACVRLFAGAGAAYALDNGDDARTEAVGEAERARRSGLTEPIRAETSADGVEELHPWTGVNEGGECILDCCWYPALDWSNPRSFAFAVSSRDLPIHLYSGIDCELLATYTCYDKADAVCHAFSLAFHPRCPLLLAGGNSSVCVFDLDRPGRNKEQVTLCASRRSSSGQKGLISSLDFKKEGHAAYSLLACGSYSGTVCTYTAEWSMHTPQQTARHALAHRLRDDETVWGGVTQVKFVGDNLLVSGHRQDNFLRCWDLRLPNKPLLRINRNTSGSSQKFSFDVWSGTEKEEKAALFAAIPLQSTAEKDAAALRATRRNSRGEERDLCSNVFQHLDVNEPIHLSDDVLVSGNEEGQLSFFNLRTGNLIVGANVTTNASRKYRQCRQSTIATGLASSESSEQAPPLITAAFNPSGQQLLTVHSSRWLSCVPAGGRAVRSTSRPDVGPALIHGNIFEDSSNSSISSDETETLTNPALRDVYGKNLTSELLQQQLPHKDCRWGLSQNNRTRSRSRRQRRRCLAQVVDISNQFNAQAAADHSIENAVGRVCIWRLGAMF